MPSQMAAPRPNREIQSASAGGLAYPSKNGPSTPHGLQNGGHKNKLSRVEQVAVQLYGRGLRRRRIAQLLLKHLVPPNGELSVDERLRLAIARLRQMEERKWFRDALWEHALIQADLETPAIIGGVVRKAKRGRVDAAKLALGLVGRYEDHGDGTATAIHISFGAEVPRPRSHLKAIESHEAAEDGEWIEVEGEELD